MTFTKRTLLVIMALATVCLLSGCYDRVQRGEESVYHFAMWARILVIGAGVILIPLGILLLIFIKQRWGFIPIILGPVLLFLVGPSMFTDYVVVDANHFEASYGLWFSPNVHHVKFRELRELRHVAVRDSKNRIKYELHCKHMNGSVTVVHCGDLVRNAVEEILSKARAAGVSVHSDAP